MGPQNLNNYYFNRLDVKLDYTSYYDFFLVSDERDFNTEVVYSKNIIGYADCEVLPVWIDLGNPLSSLQLTMECGTFYPNNTILSISGTCWCHATPSLKDLDCLDCDLDCYTSGCTEMGGFITSICDIGLTGMDNGWTNSLKRNRDKVEICWSGCGYPYYWELSPETPLLNADDCECNLSEVTEIYTGHFTAGTCWDSSGFTWSSNTNIPEWIKSKIENDYIYGQGIYTFSANIQQTDQWCGGFTRTSYTVFVSDPECLCCPPEIVDEPCATTTTYYPTTTTTTTIGPTTTTTTYYSPTTTTLTTLLPTTTTTTYFGQTTTTSTTIPGQTTTTTTYSPVATTTTVWNTCDETLYPWTVQTTGIFNAYDVIEFAATPANGYQNTTISDIIFDYACNGVAPSPAITCPRMNYCEPHTPGLSNWPNDSQAYRGYITHFDYDFQDGNGVIQFTKWTDFITHVNLVWPAVTATLGMQFATIRTNVDAYACALPPPGGCTSYLGSLGSTTNCGCSPLTNSNCRCYYLIGCDSYPVNNVIVSMFPCSSPFLEDGKYYSFSGTSLGMPYSGCYQTQEILDPAVNCLGTTGTIDYNSVSNIYPNCVDCIAGV